MSGRCDQERLVRRERRVGTSLKFGFPSSGCESRPTKAKSGRSVVSLAPETILAMRRHAKLWAVVCQPRKHDPGAEVFGRTEGSSARSEEVGVDEERAHPAGHLATARSKRMDQEPGRTLSLPREMPGDGAPANKCSGGRAKCGRTHDQKKKRVRLRGRAASRGTGGRPDGAGGSEGRIRAMTSGNGVAAGPGRAKAARVGTSFWRAT